MASSSWAESLVGRDWEIWWSEDREGSTGENDNGKSSQGRDIDKADDAAMEIDGTMAGGDLFPSTVKDSINEIDEDVAEDSEEENESESEGSIIDDWYAGRILSYEQVGDQSFVFKTLFVGDEQIYDIVLDPQKVRPSAIGWIVSATCLTFIPYRRFPLNLLPWYE